jgi:hypothetical protein
MAQRSRRRGPMDSAVESQDSMAQVVYMSLTFLSAKHDVPSAPAVGGAALPSLGTKLSVKSPFGVRPAVMLCARSLRRSGEVALVTQYSLLEMPPG